MAAREYARDDLGRFASTDTLTEVGKNVKERMSGETRKQLGRLKRNKATAAAVHHLETDKRPLPSPPPVERQIEIALEVHQRYNSQIAGERSRLKQTVSGHVEGRVKEVERLVEKLQRKPEYQTADRFQDVLGMRVVCNSLDDVRENVARLKDEYDLADPLPTPAGVKGVEDDYISQPKDNYRSHHLIVKTRGGDAMEIQIRTVRQHQYARWDHQLYKELDPGAQELVRAPETQAYRKQISDYLYAQDRGIDPGPPPEPPAAVKERYGTPLDY